MPRLRRSRILIVESDADTRAMYRTVLEAAGHGVIEALNGRDALVKALTEQPELVITETRLPLMGGVALCEILRRDTATRSIPILVVTADAETRQIREARSAGADVVLVKPASIEQIMAETARLLNERHRSPDHSAPSHEQPASPSLPAGRARMARSKLHARFDTTAPALAPPQLRCPNCDGTLVYQHSHVGGVSSRHPEQWDYYHCAGECGAFEYRQRTRKLRSVS
jgi:DNA-binding response OmpR family regulator